jgi:hypothetical protein
VFSSGAPSAPVQRSDSFGADGLDGLATRLLDGDVIGFFELGRDQCRQAGNQRFVLRCRGPFPFRLAGFFNQFVDGVDRLLHFGMTEHDSAEHDFFGQLVGFRLNHQHGGFGTGNHEVKLATLSWLRVGHRTYWPLM